MRWTLLLLGAALARNSAQENKERRKKSRLLRKRVKKFQRITAKKRGNFVNVSAKFECNVFRWNCTF